MDGELTHYLGYSAGALDGASLLRLEPYHPFASSDLAWHSHVRQTEEAGSIRWDAWWVTHGGQVRRLCVIQKVETSGAQKGVRLTAFDWADSENEVGSLRLSIESLPFGACVVSGRAEVREHNAEANVALSHQFDPLLRRYVASLPPELRLALLAPQARAAPRGGQAARLRRADGSFAWFQVMVRELDADNALLTFIETGDLDAQGAVLPHGASSERSAGLSRQQASAPQPTTPPLAPPPHSADEHMASLGLMAAGIVHELNNPLSYLISNLAFATERAIDVESRSALREALDGATRMREIIRDLRVLSRLDSPLALQPVDIREVLDVALKLAFNQIRNRAHVERHFDKVPLALGDRSRLIQVFLNLATNAAQAIEPGAPERNKITVRIARASDGKSLVVELKDTGVGIPDAVKARVFEPFFTTKPPGEGTGLGLSICHRLLEAMHGTIALTSAPGRGTTCVVHLDIAVGAEPAQPAPPSLPENSLAPAAHVLVIDDEPLVARSVQRNLRRDYRVEMAHDGASALDLMRRSRFDVIICDLLMPDMSGLELFRHAREADPSLAQRFVFATGGVFSLELSESVRKLSNVIVEKPFESGELRRVIEQVLARNRE